MEITLTEPIESFIRRQLAKGYADPGEVARQALLRWMEDEEQFDPDPPRLQEKIQAAREGKFQKFNPERYDTLLSGGAGENRSDAFSPLCGQTRS